MHILFTPLKDWNPLTKDSQIEEVWTNGNFFSPVFQLASAPTAERRKIERCGWLHSKAHLIPYRMHIRLTPLNERKPLTKDSSFEELGTNGQKEGRNIRQKSFFFFKCPLKFSQQMGKNIMYRPPVADFDYLWPFGRGSISRAAINFRKFPHSQKIESTNKLRFLSVRCD